VGVSVSVAVTVAATVDRSSMITALLLRMTL
jgi:hypothetical protein